MDIQYIDLKTQYQRIKKQVDNKVISVLEQGNYIMGEEVYALEQELAAYTGRKYCISVSNGTDALLMALMCSGVTAGDLVLTTAFSFFATSEVIALIGAVPVFVDINPNSYNMDSYCLAHTLKKLAKAHSKAPKAVIVVDLFGQCADYERICEICDEYDLDLIEDAAQSFGAEYHGKKAGSFGRYACTSFFPAKPLGCYGDGGAIFCDSDEDAEYLQSIRVHGKGDDKYNNLRIGLNARLDTLQAAVLQCKLEIFDDELQLRQRVAERYNENLSQFVKIPLINKDLTSSYAQYTIALKDSTARNYVKRYLQEQGIPTNIYYPIPLHKQRAHTQMGIDVSIPNAEIAANTVLSLPMHPYLKDAEIDYICEKIKNALSVTTIEGD